MPLFTKNGKTILFIHIPKTAGTSVTLFFKKNGFSVDWFISSWFDIMNRESSPQHRHREKILECLDKESVRYNFNFTIVRDPVDRLLSEYFHQRTNQDARSKALTAKDFSFWVDRVFELHEENPVYFDNHIRPQSEFLLDDTLVFRYENGLKDLFDFLKNREKQDRLCLDLKKFPHELKGHNRKPVEIPPRVLEKIFRFYEKDYARFYPPAPHTLKHDLFRDLQGETCAK